MLLAGFCDLIAVSRRGHFSSDTEGNDAGSNSPLGWNSWDAYGTTVTEDEVKANADVMASALKQFGWQYIVVDIHWYEPNAKAHGYRPNAELAMDGNGRLIPALNRFPSSANGQGFKALADHVHSEGLKFGIHILRGIPRQAVAQMFRFSAMWHGPRTSRIRKAFARGTAICSAWTCPSPEPRRTTIRSSLSMRNGESTSSRPRDMARPYHEAEIKALHRAIVKSGRPIVLSLSPGPVPLDEVADLRENAQMWRIEDDLWDNWASVKNMYFRVETWAPLVVPGHWPDADMLALGHIGIRAERGNDRMSKLSHDEQCTVLNLWSIFRSPLMFGGDLATLDAFTRSLLTNAEVLAVNQYSTENKLAYREGIIRVWTAVAGNRREKYVAVFNLSDLASRVDLNWDKVGILTFPRSTKDLWSGAIRTSPKTLGVQLAPHASVLYKVAVNYPSMNGGACKSSC
jgi:alpha-galactosidase